MRKKCNRSIVATFYLIIGLITFISIIYGLGDGCDGYAATPLPSAPVVKPALPVDPQASSPYRYNPVGKPDPFYPFIEEDKALQKKQEDDLMKKAAVMVGVKKRPISPLQQLEIDEFQLVGIVWNDQRRTAVVEDKTFRKFYTLSVGMYIGSNEGRVVEILSDRVIIEEIIEDSNPKAKKAHVRRPRTMMLRKEE